MSNLNVDTVTAANVHATGMVSANTALKAPNYADAGKPASADPGVIIYNTTGQDVELWKGSTWLSLGAGNMRTWSGEEGRPTSPATGQFGFNTTTGQAEIFNGSDWITFGSNAADGAGGPLFSFNSFTFQSIVGRGSNTGPNSSQMTSTYSSEPWVSEFFKQGDYQGYQVWTVPEDGNYTIEVGGARGGRDLNYGQSNLWGAKMTGTFALTKETELSMVVGVGGNQYYSPHGHECGGGGGSFVVNKTANSPLIIAGGGGGSAGGASWGWSCGRPTSWGYGQSGEYGGRPTCYYNPSQPSPGYGGNTQGGYMGGAGGGYLTGGQNGGGHCSTAYGGNGYNNGMVGGKGDTCYTSGGNGNRGGFGGGGGGQLSGPGAGGGWTGGCTSGQWSSGATHGGGGGSYNAGTNAQSQQGGNSSSEGGQYSGNGYIKITKN